MSSEPPAFVTIDHGTATVAAALVGRVDARWRLLGATAAPASVGADPLVARLRSRLEASDPALARACGLAGYPRDGDLPRVETRTSPPPVMVVLGATIRAVGPLAAAAATAGWHVRSMAIEGADILEVATAIADPSVAAVLAGCSDPPGGDERPLVAALAALVAAATQRRPDLTLILAGPVGEPGSGADAVTPSERSGATILAPAPAIADGARLQALLDGVRGDEPDGHRALARSVVTLADVLQRRVEVVEIGQSTGTRVSATWSPDGVVAPAETSFVPAAALVPWGDDDSIVDEVAGWLAVPIDRLRLRDRLRDLAVVPWGDAAGDGAQLRMAAARAAVARLVAATPAHDELPTPDLVVAAGGVWSVAPGPAVALALADVLRRPGARALGLDHARLLGPLGMIEDPVERRQVMADLRDELLVPLGTVLMPAGLRSGRSIGRLGVRGDGAPIELDLVPGGIELVDLPPGGQAVLDATFRETVDLGHRTRRVALEVAGGLGGLLVDLRDIPLRLPDRVERRRELMLAWQAALWAGLDG